MVLWRLTGTVRYETRDTLTSLTMDFGNVVVGAASGIALLGMYQAVSAHRIFEIGFEWYWFPLCLLAQDFVFYA